jgi:hypothetical protein
MKCIVCGEKYYRRNMTISWLRNHKGKWISYIAKGHPECLRILNRVTNMWKRSA